MNEGRRSNPIQWLLIGGALLFLAVLFFPLPSGATDLEITQVLEMAAAGQVATIEVRGEKLNVTTTDGQTFSSRKEGSVSVLELLDMRGIETGGDGIQVNVEGEGLSFTGLFLSSLPLIIFVGLMFYMLRRARGGIGQVMSIGRSRAKLVVDSPSVTFDSGHRRLRRRLRASRGMRGACRWFQLGMNHSNTLSLKGSEHSGTGSKPALAVEEAKV